MNQSYEPYSSNDDNRYQRGRRRGQTGANVTPPINTTTQTTTTVGSTTGRSASGRRRASTSVPVTTGQNQRDIVPTKQSRPTDATRESQRKRSPSGRNLESNGGSVRVTGCVVSCKPSQRRNDFFHVMYDTLVKGARLSFSPEMQVITVELNDMDHTTIDSNARRTVVVTMVGKIYDGAISVRDEIEVVGQWSPNQTISAASIHNLTNGSRLAVSHAIPSNIARILILVSAVLIGLMAVWLVGDNSPLHALGNLLGGLLNKIVMFAVILLLLWWFLSGLRGPFRGVSRLFGNLIWLVVGALIVWYIANAYPSLLYVALVLGVMIGGMLLMLKGVVS